MNTASKKAKGRRLAQKVKDLFVASFNLQEDDIIVTPSGVNGEDLQLSPKARELLPFSFECKCQESAPLKSWWVQAKKNAKYTPVLIISSNRKKIYVFIKSDENLVTVKPARFWDNPTHIKLDDDVLECFELTAWIKNITQS